MAKKRTSGKPIKIIHTRPAFKSTTKPIVSSRHGGDEDVYIVEEPEKEHPHRVVSMHYNTPDGRPVSEYFDTEGPPAEDIIDRKPMRTPPTVWSTLPPLDDGDPTEPAPDHVTKSESADAGNSVSSVMDTEVLPALTAEDAEILEYLRSIHPKLATIPMISHPTTGTRIGEKLVGARITNLIKNGYVHRPSGPKKGAGLTESGISVTAGR